MTKITVDKALIEQALQQLNLLDGGAGVCESAHHVKEHQHTSREPCPIDKLHQDAIAALREALASQAGQPVDELEQENRLMRARMERLEAERAALLEAVCRRIGQACGPNSVAEMAVRTEFLK